MTQTGQLIDYLSVRELVTMMAAHLPRARSTSTRPLRSPAPTDFADRQTRKLSGGETQRVRFAIALVADAELLVLDEPTVALDVEGRRDFWSAMRAFAARGKTVIFATHYLEEADAYADRIVLMSHGRDRGRRGTDRDQGDRRRANHPRHVARRRRSPHSTRCTASPRSIGKGDAITLELLGLRRDVA